MKVVIYIAIGICIIIPIIFIIWMNITPGHFHTKEYCCYSECGISYEVKVEPVCDENLVCPLYARCPPDPIYDTVNGFLIKVSIIDYYK